VGEAERAPRWGRPERAPPEIGAGSRSAPGRDGGGRRLQVELRWERRWGRKGAEKIEKRTGTLLNEWQAGK
jgi:hypothetical protein